MAGAGDVRQYQLSAGAQRGECSREESRLVDVAVRRLEAKDDIKLITEGYIHRARYTHLHFVLESVARNELSRPFHLLFVDVDALDLCPIVGSKYDGRTAQATPDVEHAQPLEVRQSRRKFSHESNLCFSRLRGSVRPIT